MIQDAPIDKLMDKTHSMFKLVILASKRALELSENGSATLVEVLPGTKPGSAALKEILEGKVEYKIKEK